jgi:hypothetical protein
MTRNYTQVDQMDGILNGKVDNKNGKLHDAELDLIKGVDPDLVCNIKQKINK